MGAHCTAAQNIPPEETEAFMSPPPEPWMRKAAVVSDELPGKDVDVVLSATDNTPVMASSHYVAHADLHGDVTPGMPYVNSDPILDRSGLPGAPDELQHAKMQEADVLSVSDGGHGEMLANDQRPLVYRLKANGQLVTLSDVKVGRTLCSTNKSTVFLSKWQNRMVVTKMIKVDLMSKDDPDSEEVRDISKKEMLHEMQIFTAIQHPCLVEFLGGNISDPTCFMMFEYMEGGDVETYMQSQRAKSGMGTYKPPLSLGLQWCTSTAQALSFLHGQRCQIIHRDLKPLNLLLTRNLQLKVTDFGISKVMVRAETEPAPCMSGGVGTWRYMAPEVVRYEQYTDRIDIFSFSLIMYFILTGRQPFYEFCKNDPELVLKAYLQGKEPRPELTSSMATAELRQLMQDAWALQASSRPSAKECVERLQSLTKDKKKTLVAETGAALKSYWQRNVTAPH